MVGSARGVDVFIPDGSSFHFYLWCDEARPALQDIGSRHGVLLNGARVEDRQRYLLYPFDRVQPMAMLTQVPSLFTLSVAPLEEDPPASPEVIAEAQRPALDIDALAREPSARPFLAARLDASPKQLWWLFGCGGGATLRALALNPSTPLPLLEELAALYPEEVLQNGMLSLTLLAQPENVMAARVVAWAREWLAE